MKKILIIAILFFSAQVYAETHNIYVHKAGIDTSMYQQQQIRPDFNQFDGLADRIRAKREAKKNAERQGQYATDLIKSTDGMRNISSETILPLIQKYPENSNRLLEMLQKQNSQ